MIKYPVFMYHAFSENGIKPHDADLHYHISLKSFKKQIALCKKNDYQIVSLLKFNQNPDINDKDKYCFFTFDDGHVSNFEAAKILQENGFSGDFFINTSMLGKANFLSVENIKAMDAMGMSIQTHGHEHVYFSELSPQELKNQFLKSQQALKKSVGKDMKIFAPPGGRINQEVIEVAKQFGIKHISNSRPGMYQPTGNNYDIPRLPILNSTDCKRFLQLLMNTDHVILKMKLKYYFSKILKFLMGNSAYEKFRLVMLNQND